MASYFRVWSLLDLYLICFQRGLASLPMRGLGMKESLEQRQSTRALKKEGGIRGGTNGGNSGERPPDTQPLVLNVLVPLAFELLLGFKATGVIK